MGLVGMSPAADMRLGVVLSILSSLVSSMGIVLQRHYLRKHKPGDSSTQCLTLIGVLCVVLGMALKVQIEQAPAPGSNRCAPFVAAPFCGSRSYLLCSVRPAQAALFLLLRLQFLLL